MQEHVENKKSSVYENISFAVVHTDAQQIFFFFFFSSQEVIYFYNGL